jgi:cytochrome oxidase assembly protein ShyY1
MRAGVPNNHIQYGLTWYSLAVVLVAVFASFFMRTRRAAGREIDSA